MKVVVVNSPLFEKPLKNYNEDSLPPLGQGYILNELKRLDLELAFLDAFAQNFGVKETIEWIRVQYPSYVVMNVFSANVQIVEKIIMGLPTSINIILGGGTQHIRSEIMNWKCSPKVSIVEGEGELAVPAIIRDNNVNYDIIQENFRVLHVSPLSEYFPHDISQLKVDHSFFENEPLLHHQNLWEAYISTSRGCLYNCAYCGSARSRNKSTPVRERSVESIRSELFDLIQSHPYLQTIRILDDLFLKDDTSVSKSISIFNGFNLTWRAMAHILSIAKLEQQHLLSLKQSGCRELFIGIESGSKKILESIHKVSDKTVISETIYRLLNVGINVKGFFIIGFPNENVKDMKDTFLLAESLFRYSLSAPGSFRTSVFQFRPYHGTELYEKLQFENQKEVNTPNRKLSDSIGRQQFNVGSGNYSNIPNDVMMEYITKINHLHS